MIYRSCSIETDLKNIHVFVQTAKYLNFSRVAETLFPSQSSISKYISALEDEVGEKLLLRDTKCVRLTEFGLRFLPYAEHILAEEERALQFIHQKGLHEQNQTLILGINESLQNSPPNLLLFQVICSIRNFRQKEPNCGVKLRFMPSDELQSGIQNNSIHLAIMDINTNRVGEQIFPNTEFAELDHSPNFLLYSPDRGEFSSFEEFVQQVDTLIYASDPTPLSLTFDFMQKTMIHPLLHPCDTWVDLIILVLEGTGCGIVPEQLIPLAKECGLKYYSLSPLNLSSSVYAIWHSDNNDKSLDKLLQCLLSHYQEQNTCEL